MKALALRYAPWLAAALIGFAWFRAHDAKVRADAVAQVRGDSLKAALAVGDSIRGALQVKALALDSLKRVANVRYVAQRGALAQAQSRADSTASVLDSVLASLPDTAQLHIAITNERQAGAACSVALSGCDSLRVLLTAEVANRDSAIAVLEPSLESTRRLWAAAEKRASPGFFGKLRAGLPWVAGGLIVGALVIR
jgi:hypothetical protein